MRVETDHACFDKRWSAALPHSFNGGRELVIHGLKSSAIQMERWYPESFGDAMNFGCSLDSLRNADRVAIVLDYKQHRQLFPRGPVQCFKELPLAGRPLT